MKKQTLFPFILIIIVALAIRVWFLLETNYVAEDAHITFQFSRNIMRGNGFSLIPGQPIYGSTTPLLTLLLAGGLYFSKNIVLLARIVDIFGVLGGMCFLWFSIKDKRAAILILTILAFSSRLFTEEMQGMEMPLLFLFMTSSYYGFVKERPIFSGVMAGLILWTRIDAVIWVGCLFVVFLFNNRKRATQYFLATSLVYLPWIIFAWLYFGSPIPFTIIAKQVAYGIGNPTYLTHLGRIVKYIGFTTVVFSAACILSITKKELVFILFIVVESLRLILTGATFFDRYFYLLTISWYVLIGIGAAWILKEKHRSVIFFALLIIPALSYPDIKASFERINTLQFVRHEGLKEMGMWFNQNTEPGTRILLEPLGYVGWYADRIMLDEVGLVTPLTVDLKRQGIFGMEYYKYFWPDYVIWTCGEGGSTRDEISAYYDMIKVFDRNDVRCYEIWRVRNAKDYSLP